MARSFSEWALGGETAMMDITIASYFLSFIPTLAFLSPQQAAKLALRFTTPALMRYTLNRTVAGRFMQPKTEQIPTL